MPSSTSRRTVIKTGAVFLALGMTSCTAVPAPSPSSGSPSTTAAPEPSATFNFGTAAQPLGLDPALSSDVESQRITRQILEGLVGVDQVTGKPTPLLATEWTESNEGRSYTFKLRTDVMFQDGTPFNADAVCTNFNRWFAFSPDIRRQAPGSSFKGVFKAHSDEPELSIFKSCTAESPDTVRIDLTQRFTAFLQALTLPAFAIASPAALAAGTADVLDQNRGGQPVSGFGTNPVGTGPFRLASWDEGSVTLATNTSYWGERGQIATINFVAYDHPQARLQALLDGKIDGYDAVTVGNFDQLVKRGKQIVQRDPFSVMYVGINQDIPVLKNLKVRQAIEMAIDKETLIRRFFIDNTAKATQFVPPKISGFNNDAPALGHDPAKAKEYLEEGGYAGEELKFYYPLNVTRPYLPTPEKVYAEISRQLTAVGLNIRPVPVDWADGYLQKVQSPGDHALHLLGWNGSYSDADNFVGPLFGEKNGEFGYHDPQVFSKINRARGLPEGEERDEQYHTINAQIAATVPAVPVAFPISALALSDRVLSYPASPVLNEVFTKVQLKP
ncbi:ABC transporter substrate-binding protein [Arthrobacter sp. KFRI-F3372]|uniref:Peptide/nickel transport system substrate-binding protein n=1 Tax=Pseudarthrobacter oxydans TaxID=1671 RepID=A0AAW8NEL5_PSEOX|nr:MULTISPECIES: ABC transporter substrate-binding protein [Pseudarthrobacter]MDV2977497.1 ABC transporter substrate-binding protein [Actinomycetes bacterium ARC8]WHP57843.1 ABC transporter substrate-binding protein [Arthrobacter sp. KFRI-F3372]MDR6794121.1 peptide/nickel transport system substrate-binding protein [Pseudarthrobacter oxydans]MDR7165501.1 peptide/nickel transport system substrate-binding protein [Pseudarthrobacter oxydans]NSX36841.1 ABC transporter substrate-binding protein [Pse